MVRWRNFVLLATVVLATAAGADAWAIEAGKTRRGLYLPDSNPAFEDSRPLAGISDNIAEPNSDDPVTMEADSMGLDQENGIAIAQGNVTVAQGAYVLNADKITYYQRENLVVAEGNVSVLQPTGDVFFADRAQLRDDMQRGVINEFKARMSDNSVFAAEKARKVDATTVELESAVYTPCNLCSSAAPFWQIKARKMTVDDREEEIVYKDARMELGGIPILYTPYLAQPTPQAAGRSGFLTPQYSTSDNLGSTAKVPYYWRIDHDKDVTLTPWWMSDEGWLLEGEYNQLTDNGDYKIEFSGTNPDRRDSSGNRIDGHEFRGHIYAEGEERLGDFSRLGFDINRATDDTYLRRYGFGSQPILFSRVYSEAAKKRNFALAQALAIQGMRATDDPDTTPMVLPTFEGYYETTPLASGLRFHAFGDAQSLTRKIGADQHRLSVSAGASLPYVSEGGHVFTSTVNLRQDVYRVEDVATSTDPSYDGTETRTVPQGSLEWRYPLIKPMESGDSITIEPIVLAVLQPNGGNPQEIPNEDNTLIELSDTNLFSLNRMPGLDTIDSGPRAAYGFRAQYLFAGGESVDAMFGQNYSADDTPFPNSTTPGENASDYIGRIGLFADPLEFSYRFGIDKESGDPNRTEFTLGFNKPWLTLLGAYRALENNRYLSNKEEASLFASVPLADEWSVFASGRRDLELNQMIAAGTGLAYHNECFSAMLQALRSYTRDRDIEPDTSITLRVGFKNLGEFGD